MALWDEVEKRFSAQELVELTNPGDQTQTTVNTTSRDAAVLDVAAEFEIQAGVVFDLTDARHVAKGVEGVLAVLSARKRTRTSADVKRWAGWKKELADELGPVTGRDRVTPKTNSALQPSEEQQGTEVVRPAFDDEQFAGFELEGGVPDTRDW